MNYQEMTKLAEDIIKKNMDRAHACSEQDDYLAGMYQDIAFGAFQMWLSGYEAQPCGNVR